MRRGIVRGMRVLALALFVAAPAFACGADVVMKVVGFDAKSDRVLVRSEWKGDSEELSLQVIELRSGKRTTSFGIISNDDDPAERAALRGKRWKEAEATLKKDGFTVVPDYPAVEKNTVKLANGVTLKIASVRDDDSGFSGNELVASQGDKSVTLVQIVGAVSDSPHLSKLYLSPDKRWAVAVEGGCADAKTHVFEVAALPKKVAAGK